MNKAITIEELHAQTGQVVGISGWFDMDQARIDAFANATDDHQFIHVDPARVSAETPFDTTIAHGFLTLSMLSAMSAQALPKIVGHILTLNYGLNHVRFLNPVPSGGQVRAQFELLDVTNKAQGSYLCKYASTVEIMGIVKPALVAEQLLMLRVQP